MSTPNLAIEQALAAMFAALEGFLSPVLSPPGSPPTSPPGGLPAPNLSLVSVTERTVGLGNRRGTDLLGPFAVLSLKGLRLEAVVRYQFWGNDPADADNMISILQTHVSASTSQLRTLGFLQITAEATSLADHVAALNFWRRTADFRVLFEFRYQDADGAESLIARIPIDIDGEIPHSDVGTPFPHSTSVSDDMTRWDDLDARALPVRRKHERNFNIKTISMLAHLPTGWNGESVTVTITLGGTTTPHTFPTMRDFLNEFVPEPEIVTLGGKAYQAGHLAFPQVSFLPVLLSGAQDVLRISYNAPKFTSDTDVNIPSGAVVYLRVLS